MTPTERLLTILRCLRDAKNRGESSTTSTRIQQLMGAVYPSGDAGDRKWRRDIQTLRQRALIETDLPPNRTGISLRVPAKPERAEDGAVNRRPAVIVDMDGTLCDVSPVIHLQAEPDGFTAFHEGCAQCPPHQAVIDWCIDHHGRGHDILIVTGRDAWTRELTEQWLAEHLPVPTAGLHMRPDGDFRSNAAIKREIHSRLAVVYEIRGAIDDDPEIVELWQELGIPVAMVLDWGEVLPSSK